MNQKQCCTVIWESQEIKYKYWYSLSLICWMFSKCLFLLVFIFCTRNKIIFSILKGTVAPDLIGLKVIWLNTSSYKDGNGRRVRDVPVWIWQPYNLEKGVKVIILILSTFTTFIELSKAFPLQSKHFEADLSWCDGPFNESLSHFFTVFLNAVVSIHRLLSLLKKLRLLLCPKKLLYMLHCP
jgi:hypothetical protein